MIKKVVFILMATLASTMFAFGQESFLKRGDIIVSGITGASFSSNSIKMGEGKESGKLTLNHFALNGSVGYLITDRIAVGSFLSYANISLGGDDGRAKDIGKISITGLNAYGRYYLIKPVGVATFAVYGQVNLGVNNISAGDNLKASGPAYGGAVGVNYFISENIALDCSLNYTSTSIKIDNMEHKLKGGTLNFLVGISIKL